MSDAKTKKQAGRKPVSQMTIYRQAEYFDAKLRELDEERAKLVASIPKGVARLMAIVAKVAEPEAEAAPEVTPVKPPAAPSQPKSNGKPNGSHAQA